MDEETFHKKLDELVKEIGNLPKHQQTKLLKLAEETKKKHKKLNESVGSLQDSLDYLRLSVKYLLFDLEATRRENAYLRGLLEDNENNKGYCGIHYGTSQ